MTMNFKKKLILIEYLSNEITVSITIIHENHRLLEYPDGKLPFIVKKLSKLRVAYVVIWSKRGSFGGDYDPGIINQLNQWTN